MRMDISSEKAIAKMTDQNRSDQKRLPNAQAEINGKMVAEF